MNLACPRQQDPRRGGWRNGDRWKSRRTTRFVFPGLEAEWAKWDGQRPFVGTLTMELQTDTNEEVASWIAAGKPPICFGFGSMPVQSPAETLEMISAACEQLGERALICVGGTDFSDVPDFDTSR